jgi:hypothetical protein
MKFYKQNTIFYFLPTIIYTYDKRQLGCYLIEFSWLNYCLEIEFGWDDKIPE